MREAVGVLTGLERTPDGGEGAPGLLDLAINPAALRFVPNESLQAKGYGACRILLNQATTTKGTKR